MSNSFNISVIPEIAALEVKVDTAITNIATVDTVVDAVKLKTDATPQLVRGQSHYLNFSTGSNVWTDALNIAGSGKLLQLSFGVSDAGTNIACRITIDGVTSGEVSHIGDTVGWIILPVLTTTGSALLELRKVLASTFIGNFSAIEFDSSLQIEVRRTADPGATVYCNALYVLDAF